jgi:hypothetical protein
MSTELEKAVVRRELELRLEKPGMVMRGVLSGFRGVDTAWKKLSPGSYHRMFEPEGGEPKPPKVATPPAPKLEKPPKVETPKPPKLPEPPAIDEDVRAGLKGLGYKDPEAKRGAAGLTGTAEERMRAALKRMAPPEGSTSYCRVI